MKKFVSLAISSAILLTVLLVMRIDGCGLVDKSSTETAKPHTNRPNSTEQPPRPNIEIRDVLSLQELTLEQIVAVNDWRSKHGYRHLVPASGDLGDGFEKNDLFTSYQGYDTDTLSKLAESGDGLASLILGRRCGKSNDFGEAERHLRAAAVDGYASALEHLAWINEKKAKAVFKSGKNDEESRRKYLVAVVDSYAWNMVFNLRFAPEREYYDGSAGRFREKLGQKADEKLVVAARMRAERLLATLQHKRSQSGRREFDNDVPDALLLTIQ